MTLVELVVVLAILVAMSGMVVALTDKVDEGARYQESSRRLNAIANAVLGPEATLSDGRLAWGGFLQDMGRLPRGSDLADLLVQGDQPTYDPVTRCGWRGPYVTRLPGRASRGEDPQSPAPLLYDDWGDDIAATLAGDGSWSLASGSDASRPRLAIPASAWRMDLAPFDIQLVNRSGIDFSSASRAIRFILRGARDGALATIASGADATLDKKPGDYLFPGTSFPGTTGLPVGRYVLVLVDASSGVEFTDIRARADIPVSPRLQVDDPVLVTIAGLAP